ncbi:MAG TPA: hypothetical protein VNZ52_05130 [Candidatus Thermoplasmatota archaeon]|nr:hypothetical protein [Candidatus Thermoplasmatota archaeon]
MRGRVLVLLIPILLSPVAAASDTMERPRWQVGDEWDFWVTGQHQGPNGPEAFAYIGKMGIVGRETLTVEGELVPALRFVEVSQGVPPTDSPSDWAGKQVDFRDGARFTWVRESDGFTLRRAGYHMNQDGQPVKNTDVTYPGGCNDYQWPYFVGKSVTLACTQNGLMHGESRQADSFSFPVKVVGHENVSVPAGTFHTFVLENGGERQYYAAEACWRVKAEGLHGNPIHMELLGFRCGTVTRGLLSTTAAGFDLRALQVPGEGVDPPTNPTPGVPIVALLIAFVVLATVVRVAGQRK